MVDGMLADVRYTYIEISEYLKEKGFDISRGSVYRYAVRRNNVNQRLLEAQAQAKEICDAISRNPNMDYTEGVLQIVASGLTSKIASAQEEWDEMDLSKAVDAVVKLSRAKGFKDKVYSQINDKVTLAVNEFKEQIFAEIGDKEPELAKRLMEFATRFAQTIEDDKQG